MNIRRPIDYSAMYAGLDQALERNLPQMELYLEIGKLVSVRKEKGAAVAAAEYLAAKYPNNSGFSPRNLRRMRDFFRTYETAPDILKEVLLIGWTQNVVIMEADLSMNQRHWYLRAVLHFGWSKAELLRQINDSAHEKKELDVSTGTCYTDYDKPRQERWDDEDSFCVSRQYLQESDGRVCDERLGEESGLGKAVPYRFGSHQLRGDRQSGVSAGSPQAGRAWNRLLQQESSTADEQRLRGVRPLDWNGPCQPAEYVSYLRRRFCRQNASADGLYQPFWRGSRPVVHWRFRYNLARCGGRLSRAA